METIIKMENINKKYQMGSEELHVLKNVNFTVKKGEFVAILGPSGSGKSTLMNIIGCMDLADSGSYLLDDMIIKEMEDDELTKVRNREIGFIFQKYHLIPTYSVQQNIIMPLLARGESLTAAQKESAEIISMLGLNDRLKHKPNELSGGQQQRVAIARAMVGMPRILLADEPTGALDRNTGIEVLELFQKLNEMGNTIIMITHDLSVAQYAGRIVKIVDGELFQEVSQAVC